MTSRLIALGLTLALLAAPATVSAQRASVEAQHGLVTSAHVLASEAGVEIMRQGGNAIDAAVATGLALTVVYPFAGNIGGGGFMLIHTADGRDVAIDYRETAPTAATRDMYVGPDGKVRTGAGSSTMGWSASGVPGSVAGFALALEKYGSGRVTWAQVCEPARRLAAEGHVVSQGTAANLKQFGKLLGQFAESKKIYLKDGAHWAAGETWVQADLGATFARLQQHGPREFYEGETAKRIAAAMAANGGTITLADLKAYRPVERPPLRGQYRGHDLVTMPPPSSGGIALLQMAGMLEPYDVRALGHNSAAKYHLFVEVMRRAFRDRAEYPGDPDFVAVPVSALLAPDYLRGRMRDFAADRATPSADVPPGLGKFVTSTSVWPDDLGVGGAFLSAVGPAKAERPDLALSPPQKSGHKAPPPFLNRTEKMETTHFSVVDAAGNAVANTYTLNGAYGSGVTIPGTGILMNNEMDDFTALVGTPNMFGLIQGEANAIVPGKRPLSSMTPTFVFKQGKLVLVTGSPGGPTIINTVLQIVSNVIDFGMTPMAAVEAPRIHHQWMPDRVGYERYGMSPDTLALLQARGHHLRERQSYEGSYQGDGETIGVDEKTGRFLGAADPRKPDAKAVGF